MEPVILLFSVSRAPETTLRLSASSSVWRPVAEWRVKSSKVAVTAHAQSALPSLSMCRLLVCLHVCEPDSDFHNKALRQTHAQMEADWLKCLKCNESLSVLLQSVCARFKASESSAVIGVCLFSFFLFEGQ